MSRALRRKEEESESSGYEDEEQEYDIFGNLKTQLIWDPKDRQLSVALRQYAETPRKVEIKARANLNTVTGRYRTWGHVRKNFYTHTPSLQRLMLNSSQREQGGRLTEPNLDPSSWLPCGLGTLVFKDWTVAPGLAYDSAQPAHPLRYTMALRKNPQVVKSSSKLDIWVSAKSLMEVDARSMQVSAGAGVRMKLIRYNVTSKQDLKLTAGLDFDWFGSRSQRTPYLKVAENNFAIRWQRGQCLLLYEA